MKPDFEKIAMQITADAIYYNGITTSIEPSLRTNIIKSLESAYLEGRKAQLKDCAALVKSWHYKKGGYETLAKAIESQEIK